MNEQDLVYRLRKRAEIRRQIQSRKSVQEGKPDRLADLLEEAAAEIETLRNKTNGWSKYTLDELISQCDLLASVTPANMPIDRAWEQMPPVGLEVIDEGESPVLFEEIFKTTARASSAIDDALAIVDASNKRIDAMESRAVTCPVCGAGKLVHGPRDVPYSYKGQSTILPALTGNYCPVCSNLLMDLDEARRAMGLTLAFRNKVDAK